MVQPGTRLLSSSGYVFVSIQHAKGREWQRGPGTDGAARKSQVHAKRVRECGLAEWPFPPQVGASMAAGYSKLNKSGHSSCQNAPREAPLGRQPLTAAAPGLMCPLLDWQAAAHSGSTPVPSHE